MFYTSMNGSKRQNIKGNQKLDSWSISEQNFPTGGSNYDKLKFFLSYAILAPSSHNTQPWLFKIVDNSIELYADRTRALLVVDPEARELTISCGAALYHLIVTIKYFGFEYRLEVLPSILANQDKHDEVDSGRDSSSGDNLLARVVVEGISENRRTVSNEEKLFQAITKRRTNRFMFENRDIPALLLSKIEAITQEPLFSGRETQSSSSPSLDASTSTVAVWLHTAKEEQIKKAIADLVAEGDRIQLSDKRFRRELASWVHPNRSQSRDGIPGYAFGFNEIISLVGPFVIRTFDTSKGQAAKDRQLATGCPILLILGTKTDEPLEWLNTGLVLGKILLLARSENIWTSFLNQTIEVPQLRQRLVEVINRKEIGYPQLLLRLGYGEEVKPTPRRPIEEVIREKT
jgi:nitroreductase